MNQLNSATEHRWNEFYKFAGGAALLIVLVGILDIVLSMSAGEARANSAITVIEWFDRFANNPISALSNLGLINFITLSLGIPVYLALYHVHQRINPAWAALAAILFFMGTAVYLSSNTIFPMLALSSQYAAASDAQKLLIEAAGRAALAQGADLTPGTFMGLFFAQLGGLIMAFVMFSAGVFSKITAGVGLFGFACMLVFFSMTAFAAQLFSTAMTISMFGGLALMAYHIMFARKFFQISRRTTE